MRGGVVGRAAVDYETCTKMRHYPLLIVFVCLVGGCRWKVTVILSPIEGRRPSAAFRWASRTCLHQLHPRLKPGDLLIHPGGWRPYHTEGSKRALTGRARLGKCGEATVELAS